MGLDIDELTTSTLEYRSPVLADAVTANNALLASIKKEGGLKPVGGGTEIRENIMYAENSNVQRYSGYDPLTPAPQSVLTQAVFDWKQLIGAVTFSGLETEVQNTGEEQLIELVEARIKNLEASMENALEEDAFSNGTGYGGLQMGGLQYLIEDTATASQTSVVGGISKADYAFWRNYAVDYAATTSTSTAGAAFIGLRMHKAVQGTSRKTDKTNLIIADDYYYDLYHNSLTGLQQITNVGDSSWTGKSGFNSLIFKGIPVVCCGGVDGSAPSKHMYFLNTKYLFYRPSKNRNMKVLKQRDAFGQDASVKYIAWAGNITANNLKLQGVISED
jgi:hypothetical protein